MRLRLETTDAASTTTAYATNRHRSKTGTTQHPASSIQYQASLSTTTAYATQTGIAVTPALPGIQYQASLSATTVSAIQTGIAVKPALPSIKHPVSSITHNNDRLRYTNRHRSKTDTTQHPISIFVIYSSSLGRSTSRNLPCEIADQDSTSKSITARVAVAITMSSPESS